MRHLRSLRRLLSRAGTRGCGSAVREGIAARVSGPEVRVVESCKWSGYDTV